ncbi:RagB/SusD family nutrient uptake outer membrane protein [Sphingobacterium faecale]|uniref:RagB/SusD family nutrient uptake outer membrane protein n=1 Tax=Sphingobacterium faecale TaxID=2803775 RepID=A0ABS1QXJ2_9SPHI|nr:RagB/SusD family nutrient uptake outer membrane protein [Sphingobacterium faecale]MBL1407148.1 RagB/SusD family nutrient uptake outer membrane protein [Sphingobacterium faecale]
MKIIYILVAAVLTLFASCDKYLELQPKDTLVVNGMPEVKMMMSSYLSSMTVKENFQISYNGRKISWPYNRDLMAGFLFYSDDADMMTVLSNSYSKKYEPEYFENKDWKGFSTANRAWYQLYSHIGYLTSVITEAERFKGEAEYATVIGEALVLRAYFALKLQQYFAPLDQENLGIPLNLDLNEFRGIPRRNQKDVYRIIIGDLHKALTLGGYKSNWNVFHNPNIIHHILAQVHMYKSATIAKEESDWQEVEKYSNEITLRYPLEATVAEINATMKPATIGYFKENPFNFLTIAWSIPPRNNTSSLWGVGSTRMMPSPELLSLYAPSDIRKEAFFDAKNNFNKYVFKILSVEDYQVLFRVADVHLMQIEAEWMNGKKAEAKQRLVAFIKNRSSVDAAINDQDFLEILRKERRKELVAEIDMRWIDMKRNRMSIKRDAAGDKGIGRETYMLEANDYRYTMPIPEASELNYNKIEQNPGW